MLTIDTTNNNLTTALNSGESLIITTGKYVFTSNLKNISNNITITGEIDTTTKNPSSIISGNKLFTISYNGVNNIEFKNIRFENFTEISFKNSNNIKFTNCEFDGFINSGIYLSNFDNIEFGGCKISNMGSTSVNPTWQGMGIYSSTGKNLKIHDSEFSYIYGHGAIFLIDTSFEISSNKIYNTFYRGIELYQNGNSGVISYNNISNCGKINTTSSAVGCNGIYTNYSLTNSTSNVVVEYNTITNVLENGIEGNYKSINNNTIDGTGIDMKNHYTPSPEGIFPWGSANIVNNVIKNTYYAGIKIYSQNTISNLSIKNNKIYDASNSDYAIELNSETGYSDITIVDNVIYGEKYSVFLRNKPKSNVYINNNTIQTIN